MNLKSAKNILSHLALEYNKCGTRVMSAALGQQVRHSNYECGTRVRQFTELVLSAALR